MVMLKFFAVFLLCQLGINALDFSLSKPASKSLKLARKGRFDSQKSGTSKIHTDINNGYFVNVGFGTPPKYFSTALSLHMVDTLVLNTGFSMKNHDNICEWSPCFDSNKSSTYIKDGRQYEGYETHGFYGLDSITLGSLSFDKITLENASFVQLTSFDSDSYDLMPRFTLGLSMKKNKDPNVESIFQSAVRQGVLDKPLYSIWIDQDSKYSEERRGQLTLGNINSHCSNDVVYAKFLEDSQYDDGFIVGIDGVLINGKKTSDKTLSANVKFDDPYMSFPLDIFKEIVDATNAQYDFTHKYYTVDCGVKFELSISIGDEQLTISEKTTIAQIDESYECILLIHSDHKNNEAVLGEPFAFEYCYVYELSSGNEKIGFAKADNLDF